MLETAPANFAINGVSRCSGMFAELEVHLQLPAEMAAASLGECLYFARNSMPGW